MAVNRSKPARSEQWRLPATHRAVKAYYAELADLQAAGYSNEQTLRAPMQKLLSHCTHSLGWQFAAEASFEAQSAGGGTTIRRVDATIFDEHRTVAGDWEAKDDKDDLDTASAEKFAQGYPKNNIVFTTPSRLVLRQHGAKLFDQSIAGPQNAPNLAKGLELFFMQPGAMRRKWSEVVGRFTEELPRLGAQLVEIIQAELTSNTNFEEKFSQFGAAMRSTVNPNIAQAALIEMLTQHLLTERLFQKVFENPEFVQRNAIARQLHEAVQALSGQRFRPAEFFKGVEYFYTELELHVAWQRSRGLSYEDRLFFLNGIYERFFQGFSVKVADTHGIMYTPRPLVDFMLNSIDTLLQEQFGLAEGMAAPGVHVLDPFCGTGNFLVRLMQRLPPAALARKYARELHANEVMLLPYYIAALNLEYAYHRRMGEEHYIPFEGLCLVDSFSITPKSQGGFVFNDENTERVKMQQAADIMVIVGNPPYNAGQVHENDNNKNRLYPELDQRIRETYAAYSSATLKNALYDPYVRAIRWASDRIREKEDRRGIVAFVTNSGFLDGYSFDGMRWHLARDFDSLHVLDLGGNIRKKSFTPGPVSNVFGIRVGVSVNLLARTGQLLALDKRAEEQAACGALCYAATPETGDKDTKLAWLDDSKDLRGVDWQPITPNGRNRWLHGREGAGWEELLPLGSKQAKQAKTSAEAVALFKTYSNGVVTRRDAWCYNFSARRLEQNMQKAIAFYNDQVGRWMVERKLGKLPQKKADWLSYCDSLVEYDSTRLAWDSMLKRSLMQEQLAAFAAAKIRRGLYRPFCTQWLYFDSLMVSTVNRQPYFFPTSASEEENLAICITDAGSEKPFMVLMVNRIPDLHLVGAGSSTQCFPLYTYNPDGSGRTSNLTGWGLDKAQEKYGKPVTREDVFYYAYAVLHHPGWRSTYAENLRMSLARLSLAPALAGFEALSQAGRALGELHVGYERALEYPLHLVETANAPRSEVFTLEKMRWADQEKTTLRYNTHLQVEGFPPEAQQYVLGNRSALDWVIDRYQIKADKHSGIINDPNDADDPRAVLRLLAQVVHVSCETVRLVGEIGQVALD